MTEMIALRPQVKHKTVFITLKGKISPLGNTGHHREHFNIRDRNKIHKRHLGQRETSDMQTSPPGVDLQNTF